MVMPTEPTLHVWLSRMLQTSDPLFPTGAYAHSFGLEEMVRLDGIAGEAPLLEFLKRQVVPALQALELPLLREAHAAAAKGDVATLLELNAELDAWKLAKEWRESSLQIGSRRLLMLRTVLAQGGLQAFAEGCGGRAHHLVVCGVQGWDAPCDAVLTGYYYQTLAGYCSAALKLIRIGQEGCQRVLATLLADTGAVVEAAMKVARSQAGWFNPMLEIAAMRHERAFERLFIS
jgi:urease accessory protein